ncbi:MAG TPA: 2Fe-2S iron-sulfur cluster-binding protein [Mariprofundaceae bacterium]|nr:2Fe-2S iron-sulfur cluster-binding protein [Mariprofundaceae bacterium]
MPTITFEGRGYDCRDGESVLDSMTRHGVLLPSSCRAGACQTCMIRALKGNPTPESQSGLKDTLKAQNYFLACLCRPANDLEIGLAAVSPRYETRIVERDLLQESVIRLRMEIPEGFSYQAGQFINLIRPSDELIRSYSLASTPEEPFLELHIRRVPEGQMSNWVFDHLQAGDEVHFYGPSGDCFYLPGNAEQPLLLAGTGTGLAPLFGIMKEALARGHTGPIHLFHASLAASGLYLMDELRNWARQHTNLHYLPCVLHGDIPEGGLQGNVAELPAKHLGSLTGYRIYLCGDPPIVDALRQKCFLAGASILNIHADPFVFSPSAA